MTTTKNKKKVKQLVEKGVVKVPMIMQLEATECGAASLAMITAYFDKWLPLERTRQDCAVSRDGSNAKNILLAARSYGFEAHAFSADLESVMEEGPFPCIIHWGFNHFVVLDGFKKGRAYLNDPARGVISVDMKEFSDQYTGVILVFEPGENFEPSGKKKSILEYAVQRLRGSGTALAFVVLMSIISSLLAVIQPGFSRVFLDRLLTGQNAELASGFFGFMAAFVVLQILISAISTIYSTKIQGKMAAVGSTSYLWKVLHLPMHFFSQRLAGDISDRQSMNASIAGTLVNTLAPLVLNLAMMLFYLIVMIRYSVMLTAVGVASVIINFFMSRYISNKRINITRVQTRDAGKLSASTVSGISMVETLKACGAEDGYFEKWSGLQASVNAQNVAYAQLNQYLGIVPALVSSLSNVAVLGLGVWLVLRGEFTAGMVMAFQTLLSSFTAPATSLIAAGQTIQEMTTQMERLEDVMSYPNDSAFSTEPPEQEEGFQKLTGRLEMKNVTFGYSRLDKPLLKDFNLTLEPGKKVAFVGASGCGKSTLAKLISGLYQPWSGEILFDGKPISEIDHNTFTGSVCVVDQEISMFDDTISNNVKMWNTSIEDFEMILAARDACIHDDIMVRESGYQHKLMENGRDFSGGQRQRLEIARALAQEPTLLIMDEATSALDAKTEYDVVNRITDRGITCVVIAHRLSTIRDCDEIIVLNKGEVVERGTHSELFALGGLYTSLVTNE